MIRCDITVGLPVYNSKKIVWLAMEGLCRQDTDRPWELLICEEVHAEQTGKAFFNSYLPRLQAAGCVNMEYIELKKWVNLSEKWCIMANKAKGDIFVLQAADCFSDSERLKRTGLLMKDAHWYFDTTGHFYNIQAKKMALYRNPIGATGLNMAIKTKYICNLPPREKKSSTDGFLYRHVSAQVNKIKIAQNKVTQPSLDTDGMNNISRGRKELIINLRPPFHAPTMSIEQILPKELIQYSQIWL